MFKLVVTVPSNKFRSGWSFFKDTPSLIFRFFNRPAALTFSGKDARAILKHERSLVAVRVSGGAQKNRSHFLAVPLFDVNDCGKAPICAVELSSHVLLGQIVADCVKLCVGACRTLIGIWSRQNDSDSLT